jgi:hypothetical protein
MAVPLLVFNANWVGKRKREREEIYVNCSKHANRFIQLSSMTLGGIIAADSRMRRHEDVVRLQKRAAKMSAERDRRRSLLQQLEREEEEWQKANTARKEGK